VSTIHRPAGSVPVDPARSLGSIVAERPARARVLEAAGLDYCCHGQRSLSEACAAAGLDTGDVAAALGAVDDVRAAEVDQLDPAALVDHIESTHHAYLHEELPLLDALAVKVAGVHGERHPELAEVARLVGALRAELEPHLAKEEQVLFPAIRRLTAGPVSLPFGSIENPIRVMLREHEQAGELLAALRSASGGYAVPDDGCASYRSLYERLAGAEADTFRHIHLENNVLFPAVEAIDGDG
jgi:regulator of cell morphogenesis and NO signaling